jgi:hypothetical protein
VFVVVTGFGSDLRAQNDTEFQGWWEIDGYYRIDAQWRLFGLASLTRYRESQTADFQVGAHLDFSFFPIAPLLTFEATEYERYRLFLFRAGYLYARGIGSRQDEYLEHSVVAEAHIRLNITEYLLLSDRNRFEGRRINGEGSWRYRNRVRLERLTRTAFLPVNPYLSFEVLYDERVETFNRLRTTAGIEWNLSGTFVLDTYYMYQSDSRFSPATLHVGGVSLSAFLP